MLGCQFLVFQGRLLAVVEVVYDILGTDREGLSLKLVLLSNFRLFVVIIVQKLCIKVNNLILGVLSYVALAI